MGKLLKQHFLYVFVRRTIYSGESQFKTSSIFAATVFNVPESSVFRLDVYSTHHRKMNVVPRSTMNTNGGTEN